MSDVGSRSDKFMLRLPDGLRSEIKDHARENRRSMNSEIVLSLEQIYRPKTETASAA